MKPSLSRLATGTALVSSVAAITVTSGSSCDQQCGNVLDATTPADIPSPCYDSDFSSTAGTVLKNCMNCELTSTYYTTSPNSTDQQWLLYNSRYTLSECLWGEPGNISVSETVCTTSRACGPLQTAFQYANLSTDAGAYDYCANWSDSVFVTGCENCLRSSSQTYLANMVSMLQVGCDQKPDPGTAISIDGSIFSTTLMNGTTPTPVSSWTNINVSGPLTLGAKVGIALGALCLLLAIAGFCIVCIGRRRRRAFLRDLASRHKDAGWPHPYANAGAARGVPHRGPDMNETPLSQKPLRGWDDSPQSATASESRYGRFYSPYASPVSATGAPQPWPQGRFHDQPTQEEEEEAARRRQRQPVSIGVALGGDEPSLRTQPSDPNVLVGLSEGQGSEQRGEAYELHETGSSSGGSSAGGMGNRSNVGHSNSFRNRMARENATPVLQHPGYGRYSPDKVLPPPPPRTHAMSGGLRDGVDEGGQI